MEFEGAELKRPIAKKNGEVSLSAFAYLYSGIVQYCQTNASDVRALERQLQTLGRRVGIRIGDLSLLRDKSLKRECKLLNCLQYITTTLWKLLFGKAADSLERSNQSDKEYMITDNDPCMTRFVSLPKDLAQLSCTAFVAGVVEAVLSGAGFGAEISSHVMPLDGFPGRSVLLIRLSA